jgi:hypothetical protein
MINPDPCSDCGRVPEPCSFCTTVARYFIDAQVSAHGHGTQVRARVDATVYFCDNHAHSLLSDEARDGVLDVEVGLYCPNTECGSCDSWR